MHCKAASLLAVKVKKRFINGIMGCVGIEHLRKNIEDIQDWIVSVLKDVSEKEEVWPPAANINAPEGSVTESE